MTQDEIIDMAKQAGAMFDHMTWVERDLLPVFERFAKLVEQRTWVGLTHEEIDGIIEDSIDKVDALIQTMDKLKEKNT